MYQDDSVELFLYWNRLRGKRPAPRRTEIEPRQIKSVLGDTFILEQDARGEPIFRLAGTRLCASYGRELKGYAFPLIWSMRDQRVIARLAYSAFHENAVVVVTFDALDAKGRRVPFEMLLLPLESGFGSPRLLGSMIPCERPYWLGSEPIVENRIDTLRVVDPEKEAMFLRPQKQTSWPSLVPDDDSLLRDPTVAGRGGRRIRHLVVIEGGRGD